MDTLEKLSSSTILKSASAVAIDQIKEASVFSEEKIRKADEASAATILKAKEQATKLYNKSIDTIFLADDQGIRICDELGNEHDHFQIPTPAYAMTVDSLNKKLYFLIETTAQPITVSNEQPTRKLVEVTLFATSLQGTDIEELKKMQYNVPIDVTITGSIDINPMEERLIWISPTGTIQSMKARGIELHELAKANFSLKTAAVHATLANSGTLFWTALEKETAREWVYGIWKLEKDSTEVKRLISYAVPLAESNNALPSRVHIDESTGKVYWNNFKSIETITLEGLDRQTIYESETAITGLEFDFHLNRLYWLEHNNTLVRSSLDGKNIEHAISFEPSELQVKSVYIRTKADEAAGILQAAQIERQRAAQKTADDISKANKEAYAYLSPIQESYQAAEALFKEQIAPVLKAADDLINPAKTQYLDKKAQADKQLADAKSESAAIVLQAREEKKRAIAEAQAEADKTVGAAKKKLDEAQASK